MIQKRFSPSPLRFRESIVLIAVIAAITIVGYGALLAGLLAIKPPETVSLTILALTVPSISSIIVICIRRYLKRRMHSWESIGFRRPTYRILHLLWQVPVMLIVIIGVQLVAFHLMGTSPNGRSSSVNSLIGSVPPVAAIGLAISIATLVPIYEEIIFRGVIYGGLRRKWHIIPSLLLSSLIFGGAHAIPALIPYFTVFGIALAYLYEFHKTLWSSLIAHVFINTLVTVPVLIALLKL